MRAAAVQIRPARPDDATRLGELLHRAGATNESWAPGFENRSADANAEYVAAAMARADAVVLVAVTGSGTPVGVCGFESGEAGACYLRMLFVDPEHWGRGIATELLSCAFDAMRARRYASVYLWTFEGNRRTRAFYARRGWTDTRERRFHDGWGQAMARYRRELA